MEKKIQDKLIKSNINLYTIVNYICHKLNWDRKNYSIEDCAIIIKENVIPNMEKHKYDDNEPSFNVKLKRCLTELKHYNQSFN